MGSIVAPLRLSDFHDSDGNPVNPPVFIPFQRNLCDRFNQSLGVPYSIGSSFYKEMTNEGWGLSSADLNAPKIGYSNPVINSQHTLKISYPGSEVQKINVTDETINRTSSGWYYSINPTLVPQEDPLMTPRSVIPTDRGFVTAVNINSAVPMIMIEVLQDCQDGFQLMLEKRVT